MARQDAAAYAATCAGCHGTRYQALFLDWRAALDRREAKARARLAAMTASQAPGAARLRACIEEAATAGMHNVQEAVRLWNDIPGEPVDEPR